MVIRKDTLDLPPMKALLEMASCKNFKDILRDLGGYDTRDTGTVLAEY
jgi:molybdate-binding protein